MKVSRVVTTTFVFYNTDGRSGVNFVTDAIDHLKAEGLDVSRAMIDLEKISTGSTRLTIKRVLSKDNFMESSAPLPYRWAE